MMRTFKNIFWILLLAAIALGFAASARYFPGTAVFTAANTEAKMTLSVFALLLIALVAALIVFWRIIGMLTGIPSRWSNWREQSRENRSLAALQTATLALHEGRWTHADTAVKIAAKHPNAAGLAALLGAESAHAQDKPDQATSWLNQLDGLPDAAEFDDAQAMLHADMALAAGDASAALGHLDGVSHQLRKHSLRYRDLLVQSHAGAGHWHEVLQIALDKKWQAPIATKNKWHSAAIIGLIQDESSTAAYLSALYKDMPDGVRADDALMQAYTQALTALNAKGQARRVIEEGMRHTWRPVLLQNYVQAADDDSLTAQLKMLDAWEQQRTADNQPDAALYCAAGQLCYRATIWGRAKVRFQESLAIAPSVIAHHGLALTYRALEDDTHANEEDRKAAALAVL